MADENTASEEGRPATPLPPCGPVPDAEAAEYMFDGIRALLVFSRDYDCLRFAGWLLEMAALEVAPRMRPEAFDDRPLRPRPLRRRRAPPVARAGG
jgi:hypothetical protein